jgi:hypothetical protein
MCWRPRLDGGSLLPNSTDAKDVPSDGSQDATPRFAMTTRLLPIAVIFSVAVTIAAQTPERGPMPREVKPQWQRTLTGDDAKTAGELQKRFDEAAAKDDYPGAIQASEELLRLRSKVQGADHWETIDRKAATTAFRKIAALPAEKRQGWREAEQGATEADKLEAKGQYAPALPLRKNYQKWCQEVLGEEHPDSAGSYCNVAANLNAQAKYAEAQPLYQKALAIHLKALGEDHPDTAQSYNNLAGNLDSQGKYAEAEPFHRKALDIRRKALGEDHPDTALGYSRVAGNLIAGGNRAEAQPLLERAVHAYEASRLAGATGLDRASLATFNPRLLLAAIQAQANPQAAWTSVEMSLARGLLDQEASRVAEMLTNAERAEQTEQRSKLAAAKVLITALVTKSTRTAEETKTLDILLAQRREAEERLAAMAVIVSQREVASPEAIRGAIPPTAALLFWVDVASKSGGTQEHWACVVRRTDEPKRERLPGSGPEKNWTRGDDRQTANLRERLRSRTATLAEIEAVVEKVRAQRIAPILKYLDGVTTLYVVLVHEMAGIPVDLLAPEYQVESVLAGTALARAAATPGPPSPASMLALGDPVFTPVDAPVSAKEPPLLPGGLLILNVVPGGAADRVLRPGDVLLAYGGTELTGVDILSKAIAANAEAKSVAVKVWRVRDGQG